MKIKLSPLLIFSFLLAGSSQKIDKNFLPLRRNLMKTKFFFTLTFALMFILTSCNALTQRDTSYVTQTYPLQDITHLALGTSGELYLTQGDTESLTIETSESVLPRINVTNDSGQLTLTVEPDFNFLHTETIIYRLTVKNLNAITLSGSGDIFAGLLTGERLDVKVSGSGNLVMDQVTVSEFTTQVSGSGDVQVTDLQADTVETHSSGSSDVTLNGKVETHTLKITGSGQVLADNLETTTILVEVNGSGEALLWAQGALEVEVSGSGEVEYYGNPHVEIIKGEAEDIHSLGMK
jgi:hypothetical protein